MARQFFVAAMALAAFSACSESDLLEVAPEVAQPATDVTTSNLVRGTGSSVLTDVNGQKISKVSSNMGTYYLNIKTKGIWYIETDNAEFVPTKIYGRGNAVVPVLIGNNWAESRVLSYSVKYLAENNLTRGDGDEEEGGEGGEGGEGAGQDNEDEGGEGGEGDGPGAGKDNDEDEGGEGDGPGAGKDNEDEEGGEGDGPGAGKDDEDEGGEGDGPGASKDKDKDEDEEGPGSGKDKDKDEDEEGGEEENNGSIVQESTTDLEGFKQIVNSNLFVGYGYNPTKNVIPELCTGIEIFQMDSLNNTNSVKSSLSPQTKQMYYAAHSEDVLDNVLSVNGSPGGNFGTVKLDTLGVDVKKNSLETTGQTIIQKSLTRSVYGREFEFANIMTDKNGNFNDANFSSGFKYYKKRYILQFKAAGNNDTKKRQAAEEFFKVVGSHFITKALLGSQLDYRMVLDSSSTKKVMDAKAALDFKWAQQVKDTTGVDSALLDSIKKHNANLKNFVFKAGVAYKDDHYNAATSTTALCKARGGDVERVNILTTGGTLQTGDLARWLLGTEPEKAVMVGIENLPIYFLFDDTAGGDEAAAREYLQEIVDAHYKIDGSIYEEWGKLNDNDYKEEIDKNKQIEQELNNNH